MEPEAVAKRPLIPTDESSLDAPAKRVRAERPGKRAGAAWDVAGRYKLQCTCKHDPVDASEYILDIHFEHGTTPASRLHASFDFPNLDLKGVMRLCPKSALSSRPDELLFLPEFEAACDLADDVAPGPKNKEWLMRWRGEEGGRKVGGETRAQALFAFSRGNDRSSSTESGEPVIQILFGMVHNARHLLFQGTQVSTQVPAAAADPDSAWKRLFEPSWENPSPSDAVDDEVARPPRVYNHWEHPRPGSVIKARNKPGPGSGYVINQNAMSPYLEDRPDWAWNVTGTYKVDCPELAERVASDEAMVLTIFMENNSKRQKTGRQLWGQFNFGILCGNLRLCPGSVAEFGVADRDQPFEAACVLQPGVWPGPAPRGERRWGFMWRGFLETEGLVAEDHVPSDAIFADYGEGRMTFVGHFKYGDERFLMQALKFKPGVERSRADPTPNTEWLKYKPRGEPL